MIFKLIAIALLIYLIWVLLYRVGYNELKLMLKKKGIEIEENEE